LRRMAARPEWSIVSLAEGRGGGAEGAGTVSGASDGTGTEGQPPWYVTFFGEDYLRIYAPVLPPERTAREVEGLVRLLEQLGVPPGGAVLDLACGHGRHAIPLAQQGYRVTGQDLSRHFLRRAQEDARAAHRSGSFRASATSLCETYDRPFRTGGHPAQGRAGHRRPPRPGLRLRDVS
jgi:SAM-dependent methyltransferase